MFGIRSVIPASLSFMLFLAAGVQAGTITSVAQIVLEATAGATQNQSTPVFPGAGQVQSLTASAGAHQTWIAGSWNSGYLDAWYATSDAQGNGGNSAKVTFNGSFAQSGNYSVQFTPELAGGFSASGLSVLVSSGNEQITLTSTQTTGSLQFYSNSFSVAYSMSGAHDSPFNTTSPQVGGRISFDRLFGEEGPADPVPGVGLGAFMGIGGLARRRRRR